MIRSSLKTGFRVAVLAIAMSTPAAAQHVGHAPEKQPVITVYKDPNCGCCNNWVAHLIRHGYRVVEKNSSEMTEIKRGLGVPQALESCHTAVVAGYVVEGHVPAPDIKRLLKQKPKVVGLAVPGMPVGSPGMEGSRVEAYSVLAFDKAGKTEVFAKH